MDDRAPTYLRVYAMSLITFHTDRSVKQYIDAAYVMVALEKSSGRVCLLSLTMTNAM